MFMFCIFTLTHGFQTLIHTTKHTGLSRHYLLITIEMHLMTYGFLI